MKQYESLNYMNIDDELTEEELLIRQTVRDFISNEVIPILRECNQEERFPTELIPRFGEMGLLGSNLQGHGLPGLGSVAYGILMQELERGD